MPAAQGAQSQLATHEIEYERLEDIDFLNSKKLLKLLDTKKTQKNQAMDAILSYMNEDKFQVAQEIPEEPWAKVKTTGCLNSLWSRVLLTCLTVPICYSYIIQSIEFFRVNLDHNSTIPVIPANNTNDTLAASDTSTGLFDVTPDGWMYGFLSSLRQPSIVASPLLNLLLARHWLNGLGFSRYTKKLLISSFLWAAVAGLPMVAGTKEAMENLELGDEFCRWSMMVWLSVANSIMFIKPVSTVIRQISSIFLSNERAKKLFYSEKGYCQDGVDRVLDEIDISRSDFSKLDKTIFKIAYIRAVSKAVRSGVSFPNGDIKYNLSDIDNSLNAILPNIRLRNKYVYAIAMFLALFYAYGSLPDIASMLSDIIINPMARALDSDFSHSYDCGNRLETLAYFPATVPNLLFDAICIYSAWLFIGNKSKELFKDPSAKAILGFAGCLFISLLTAPPSMLQAGLCSAFLPLERKIYQGLTLVDTSSVNFAGLTGDDVSLPLFVFQFLVSWAFLEFLRNTYDNTMFESLGLLAGLHLLTWISDAILKCLGVFKDCTQTRFQNGDISQVEINRRLVYQPLPDEKKDKKQLKMAEKLLEELRNKAFGEPDDASRTYYQHGRNGFFKVVDGRARQAAAESCELIMAINDSREFVL